MPIDQAYAGGAVETQDEGVVVQSATTSFDFVGTGISVADAGGGKVTVTVAGGAAPVDTVFGRTGTVVAVSGDYTGAQVTFTPAGDLTATEIQAAIEEARRLVLGRSPVDLATTGDITLSGEQTIDGTLTSASRVLVKDQAIGSENGVYLTAVGAWIRTVDFDANNEAFAGINYYIEGGTLGAKRTFFLVTTGAIVLDTTALVFEEAPASTVAASGVTNTPAGDIVATDVQAAINELDADKLATAIFDANTILAADTDDTPAAVTIGASELVGRTAAGSIAGLAATLVRTILNVADGADVSPVASVFTRTGAVVAETSDYDAVQVDFTSADDIASTNTQAAIEELRRKDLLKSTVDLATTADITLSGEQTIDGTATSASRVLVKDQTLGQENGAYVSAVGAWTRASDLSEDDEAVTGLGFYVEIGTANAKKIFTLTTVGAIVLDTTPITFEELLTGGGVITVDDEGVETVSNLATLDFVGTGVTVTDAGGGTATVTIAGGAAPVDSVFTRTGAVVAVSGDYNAGQVTFTPVDDIVATDTQAAIDELRRKDLLKSTADLATTGSDITLSGEQTIDGTLTSTSRVLVKNQTLSQENGVYVTAAGAWARASDLSEDDEAIAGLSFYIEGGTANQKKAFTLTTTGAITLGTTPIVFEELLTIGATIVTQDEGSVVDATATTINFVGAGVVATDAGGDVTLVTISGGADPMRVVQDVRNESGATLAQGTPVFQTGFNAGQGRITIDTADSASAATMPALGMVLADIPDNSNGQTVSNGLLENFDTSAFAENVALFVASGGGLTDTPPTGTGLIQKIAHVLISNASNGDVLVYPNPEPRARPNLPLDNVVVGGASAAATELPIAASGMLGRAGGAAVSSLTPAEVLSNIGVESGADVTDDANVRAALAVATADIAVNSQKITGLADGTAPSDAATFGQVTATINGLDWKDAVELATTGSITLSGEQTIDGVLTSTSRILVKDQSTGSENGLYDTAAGAWARTADANQDAEVTSGLGVKVTNGTVNGNTLWFITTADPITVGVTSITFTELPGPGDIIAGTGMTKTVNTLDVIGGAGITANPDDIEVTTGGVVNSMLADMAQSTIKGREAGAGTGVPVDLTAAQVRTAAGLVIGTDVEAFDADILKADTTDNLVVGFTTSSVNLGNLNTATTLSIASGNIQHATMTGAFTLTAPNDATEGYLELEFTVDATGGFALTLSGFNEIIGIFDNTANKVNLLRTSKLNTNTYLEITQAV